MDPALKLEIVFDSSPKTKPCAEVSVGAPPDWCVITLHSGGNDLAWMDLLGTAHRMLLSAAPALPALPEPSFSGSVPASAELIWSLVSKGPHPAAQPAWPPTTLHGMQPQPAWPPAAPHAMQPQPAWPPAAPHAMQPAKPPLQSRADPALVDDIYNRVMSHASRLGSHPDFDSRNPQTVAKVKNYITSVYGSGVIADNVLDAVVARLRA